MKKLNILPNSIAFIDDQEYEREEVRFSFPEVLCLAAEKIPFIADMPEFNPYIISSDAYKRRMRYQSNLIRVQEEEHFKGPKHEFLIVLIWKIYHTI